MDKKGKICLMNVLTLRYLEDLATTMKEDPRVLSMTEAEEEMQKDPLAKSLHEAFLKAQKTYAEARHDYGGKSEECVKAGKALHQAKLALEECPSAKAYSEAYSKLGFLYFEIDDILFHPFRQASKENCHD